MLRRWRIAKGQRAGNQIFISRTAIRKLALDEIEIFKDAISPVHLQDIFLADQAGKCK